MGWVENEREGKVALDVDSSTFMDGMDVSRVKLLPTETTKRQERIQVHYIRRNRGGGSGSFGEARGNIGEAMRITSYHEKSGERRRDTGVHLMF